MSGADARGALPRTPGYLHQGKDRMVHPGPRAAVRVQAVRCDLRPVAGVLPAGGTVMEGVAVLLAAEGARGGVLHLDGAVCAPLRYVLPALSGDGVHAAWYSDPLSLPQAAILRATASIGQREGAAFLHCHGLWAAPGDDTPRMGHLLAAESVLAADCPVTGLLAADAWFEALPDAETAFTLFQPQGGGMGGGILARIAPGEDVVTAIEALCAAQGIAEARLHGIGSIDHLRFQDGGRVDCLATELRLDGARLARGRAHVPVEVVDIAGRVHGGVLERGTNPVGVTLELVIESLEDA